MMYLASSNLQPHYLYLSVTQSLQFKTILPVYMYSNVYSRLKSLTTLYGTTSMGS